MVLVKVSEGVLEGEVIQNEYGGSFYSFKGIPYAEPPLGKLRFKAPRPAKPWHGVRSAKEFGSECYHFDAFTKKGITGSEDCLYLNVYTPNIAPANPLPVMVWIHGGAFMTGSGNDDAYGPEFLLRKGVILVTINYRLEVLGFLCLDTKDVPGNAGMKDQVQALRWIQKNISNFGGDPDNVTIFGGSAGATSVSYLLVSPMAKGLFKKAIAQSGSSNLDWAKPYKPRERAFALGRKLGLYTDDVNALYEFLMAQPYESFHLVQPQMLLSEEASVDRQIYFCIVDEKLFDSEERFFYGDIYDVLRQGDNEGIDVMTGYNDDEGIVNIGDPQILEKKIDMANSYLEYFVPQIFKLRLPIEQQLEVGQKIKTFYFKRGKISTDDWESLVKFYSMNMFVFSLIQWVKFFVSKKQNHLYLYKFTCKSERNVVATVMGSGDIVRGKPVTNHADDVLYLFNGKSLGPKVRPSTDTFKLIDQVTQLWTNFAKYGNPTPDESFGVTWPPYTLEKQDYLDIGNKLAKATRPDDQEIKFWESIYREYAPDCLYQ